MTINKSREVQGTVDGGSGVENDKPDLSIVFPAYNEEARIERTLRAASDYLANSPLRAEIVIVDDGSKDATVQIVESLESELPGIRILRLPRNRGKGFAVRSGVLESRGVRILFADADGATPIEEVSRLMKALDEGADIAIGSRVLGRSGSSGRGDSEEPAFVRETRLHRRLIGRTFHLLVQVLAIRGFKDTQCGFKLFDGAVAHDIFERARMGRFSFDVELLAIALRRGYEVREVPVNWQHQPGSRINLVADSLRMAFDLLVIRFNCLRGAYGSSKSSRSPTSTPTSEPNGDR